MEAPLVKERKPMLDLGKAIAPLIFNPAKFSILWDFLDDKDALESHFQKWRFQGFNDDSSEIIEHGVDTLMPNMRDGLYNSYVREMVEVRGHYGDMLLVAAYTQLEDIVSTFFNELFLAQPKLMMVFIENYNGSLSVPLSSVIEMGKEELMSQLARENAAKACNGEIGKVCKRIKRISGCSIPQSLQNDISVLQDKRNKVVHEGVAVFSNLDEVKKSYELVYDLLILLAVSAQSHGVKVYDPVSLLNDIPFPPEE